MVVLHAAVMLAAAMAAPAAGIVDGDPTPIAWRESYLRALDEASREHMPMLLYFSADWCEPCRKMEATTFRDEEFIEALERFIPVKAEFFSGSGLAKKFGVSLIPMMLVLDERGDEIVGRLGYLPPERILPVLDAARAGYRAYQADLRALGDFAAARRVAAYLVKLGNTERAVCVLEAARKKIPKEDLAARESADLDVAEAHELNGELARASELYSNLSLRGDDREIRARALYRLSLVELRRGRPKKAEEARAKLERLYPDLQPTEEVPAEAR